MHTKQLAADLRSAVASATGLPPYPAITLAPLDNEETFLQLANLFDAVEVVNDLTVESDGDSHVSPDRMTVVLRALTELGKRLVADLSRQAPGAQNMAAR